MQQKGQLLFSKNNNGGTLFYSDSNDKQEIDAGVINLKMTWILKAFYFSNTFWWTQNVSHGASSPHAFLLCIDQKLPFHSPSFFPVPNIVCGGWWRWRSSVRGWWMAVLLFWGLGAGGDCLCGDQRIKDPVSTIGTYCFTVPPIKLTEIWRDPTALQAKEKRCYIFPPFLHPHLYFISFFSGNGESKSWVSILQNPHWYPPPHPSPPRADTSFFANCIHPTICNTPINLLPASLCLFFC